MTTEPAPAEKTGEILFPPQHRLRLYPVPTAIALIFWCWIVCHVDPGGSYPGMPAGPGVTVDETFNVQQGVVLVEALKTYGIAIVHPATIREVFSPPLHLPDHPPLGRFWLGVHHDLVWAVAPPNDPEGRFVTACARVGSATAFALTVAIVGSCCVAWYGPWAGLMASLGFGTLPRLMAHAHLASLETMTNLTCTLAVLAVAATWNTSRPPTWKIAVGTGVFLGLALLTKIQAIFVIGPVVLWTLVRWRLAGIRPLALWGLTGLAVFFVGWPWLWLDPIGHLGQYFGGSVERAELSVWLFGEKYTDRTVPRYYSLLYWLWTVPFKLHLLGFVGFFAKPLIMPSGTEPGGANVYWGRWTPRELLLILAAMFPTQFFCLPGVPVYDCERLWLPALPFLMIYFGRGADFVMRRVTQLSATLGPYFRLAFLLLMLAQIGVLGRLEPLSLSFYGGLAGSHHGAVALKLERNYWGDGIHRPLIQSVVDKVPVGATIACAPVLHQFQLDELLRQSPILRKHQVKLVPYDGKTSAEYVLLFRRYADLPPELIGDPAGGELLAESKLDVMQLAALYRIVPPTP